MPASERIPIEPSVLEWARSSAGLDVAAAARRVKVSESSLRKWESGDAAPTIKQLRSAAAAYGRPLAVLLLPEPPQDFAPLADFRLPRADGSSSAWSPALRSAYRRALGQREVLLEINPPSATEPELDQLIVGRQLPPEEMGAVLRSVLGFDIVASSAWARGQSALRAAISAAEDLDVLVVQTQDVDPDEASGFSVADRPFPVIALNGSDTARRRLYTLLHELAHLMISTGGLCDMHDDEGLNTGSDGIERYCNEVAAAALMPADRLLSEPALRDAPAGHPWSLEELDQLSKTYGASPEAVLLRLVDLDEADWALYRLRQPELRERYRAFREREREQRRELRRQGKGGGPDYYRVKARDLGHAYIADVVEALHARTISSLDAADYLEVRFDQIPRLRAQVRTR